ncbi:MAG: hypothetical protein SNJ81_13325, partial [Cyanobacteriota bacterium]
EVELSKVKADQIKMLNNTSFAKPSLTRAITPSRAALFGLFVGAVSTHLTSRQRWAIALIGLGTR